MDLQEASEMDVRIGCAGRVDHKPVGGIAEWRLAHASRPFRREDVVRDYLGRDPGDNH